MRLCLSISVSSSAIHSSLLFVCSVVYDVRCAKISGILIFDDGRRRPFSQTVFLAPQSPELGHTHFNVLNDLLVFNKVSPEEPNVAAATDKDEKTV